MKIIFSSYQIPLMSFRLSRNILAKVLLMANLLKLQHQVLQKRKFHQQTRLKNEKWILRYYLLMFVNYLLKLTHLLLIFIYGYK